ncbi:MAG: bacillithiol biosynthesis BshC [Planctomycetia bacterium]
MTRARLVARPALAGARGPEALARTLRAGQPGALDGLRGQPQDAAAWQAEAQQAAQRPVLLPAAAWEALAARQRALGAPEAAVAGAMSLAQPGALCVVTGQQPGLLGGPLMSWHKAAGALVLAREAARATGRPVVPVFWLASEDHDLDEANTATLLDREGQPRVLSLPLKPDRRSLCDIPVPAAAWAALSEQAAACLPDTPRAREALDLLLPPAGSEEPLSEVFARALAALLGPAGLVVLEVRTLAPWLGPCWERLASAGATLHAGVRESVAPLRAAGEQAPLDPRAGDLPLFVRAQPGAARQRLGVDAQGAALRDGRALGTSLSAQAAHLACEPLCASPDVVGRVWLQDHVLPVLAYVAGPTELAYQAQVAAGMRALGERFPLALPRPSAVWADQRAEQAAAAFGRTLEQVLDGAAPAAAPSGDELRAALAALEDEVRRRAGEATALAGVGPQAARAAAQALERLVAATARARGDIEAALDAEAGVSAGRWVRLSNQLRPRGRAQERSLALLSLLARYGRDAVLGGLEALDPRADGLWVLVADAS